ncbi:hypothetical protein L596_016610 [Steinernema carpocapsae]|uniref:Uncharacterized protein n=1 Tax=Steinernema carpocapsae TaxID=34508 RepID=A0A4U5NJC7_STECR|nr:hypothetical protein L596_016610 [Steinernema carpocapsae]
MPRIVFQGFVGFHEGSPIHEGLLSFKTHPSLANIGTNHSVLGSFVPQWLQSLENPQIRKNLPPQKRSF